MTQKVNNFFITILAMVLPIFISTLESTIVETNIDQVIQNQARSYERYEFNLDNSSTVFVGTINDVEGYSTIDEAYLAIKTYIISNPSEINRRFRINVYTCGGLFVSWGCSDLPSKLKIEIVSHLNTPMYGD